MDSQKIKASLDKSKSQALKELQGLRGEIEQINEEIHWLDNAPLCLDDALVNIDGFIEKHSDSSAVEQFFRQCKLAKIGVFETKVNFEKAIIDHTGVPSIIDGVASIASVLIPIFGETIRRSLHDMAEREAEHIESGPPLA